MNYHDKQCKGCQYSRGAHDVAVCCYWAIKGHSRLSRHGYKLPLPKKCEEREARPRGRPKKETHDE